MRVLSGIQPSGTMHIGNYLGAVKQWVTMQNPDAFYCVVDLHALTLEIAPEMLREQTYDCIATLLAAGIDPGVATVFIQSRVPVHAQLNWLLECVATFGELSRMAQFKEKASRQKGYRVGLLTYPVLQAGDILLYGAEQVPVQIINSRALGSLGIRNVAPNGPTRSTLSPFFRSHKKFEAIPPGSRFTVSDRLLKFGRSPSRGLETE